MPDTNDDTTTDDTIFRSRWDVCDSCGCSTLVENEDDPKGVPSEEDWDRQQCLVCGSSLSFGNADEVTFGQQEHDRRRVVIVLVIEGIIKELRETFGPTNRAASHLERRLKERD